MKQITLARTPRLNRVGAELDKVAGLQCSCSLPHNPSSIIVGWFAVC